MAKNQTQTSADIEASGSPADMRRRRFVVHGAALGAAAGGLSLGIGPATGFAATGEPTRAGAAGLQPLEVDSPMARWKKPQSLEFVTGATERFTFPNWQSGNEDSVYYNLNIPSFFKSRVVRQAPEFSVLQRAINPDLLNLTFTAHDGTTTPTLKEYLVGPRQVQAMMMAHKGKVVFETYPGRNPEDSHVWMSASKTTAGLMISILADEGKVDLEKPVSNYAPELKGSAWDNITVKQTMNMAVALDTEETFDSLSNPKSWITSFFTAIFGVGDVEPNEWRKLLKTATLRPDEKPGDRFRYSTSNTRVPVLITEQVTQMPWQPFWNERVWSKIGARSPFIIGLTPDGTPVAGGLNNTTPDRGHAALRATLHPELERGRQGAGDLRQAAEADSGHGQYRRLQGVHGTGIRNQMVRRNAADEYRAVRPCLRRWRHVQARQHGPGDLRRSGPRLLWHVLRLGDQRREGRRHRSLPGLSPGDGETLGWRLILAFPSAEEVGAGQFFDLDAANSDASVPETILGMPPVPCERNNGNAVLF